MNRDCCFLVQVVKHLYHAAPLDAKSDVIAWLNEPILLESNGAGPIAASTTLCGCPCQSESTMSKNSLALVLCESKDAKAQLSMDELLSDECPSPVCQQQKSKGLSAQDWISFCRTELYTGEEVQDSVVAKAAKASMLIECILRSLGWSNIDDSWMKSDVGSNVAYDDGAQTGTPASCRLSKYLQRRIFVTPRLKKLFQVIENWSMENSIEVDEKLYLGQGFCCQALSDASCNSAEDWNYVAYLVPSLDALLNDFQADAISAASQLSSIQSRDRLLWGCFLAQAEGAEKGSFPCPPMQLNFRPLPTYGNFPLVFLRVKDSLNQVGHKMWRAGFMLCEMWMAAALNNKLKYEHLTTERQDKIDIAATTCSSGGVFDLEQLLSGSIIEVGAGIGMTAPWLLRCVSPDWCMAHNLIMTDYVPSVVNNMNTTFELNNGWAADQSWSAVSASLQNSANSNIMQKFGDSDSDCPLVTRFRSVHSHPMIEVGIAELDLNDTETVLGLSCAVDCRTLLFADVTYDPSLCRDVVRCCSSFLRSMRKLGNQLSDETNPNRMDSERRPRVCYILAAERNPITWQSLLNASKELDLDLREINLGAGNMNRIPIFDYDLEGMHALQVVLPRT